MLQCLTHIYISYITLNVFVHVSIVKSGERYKLPRTLTTYGKFILFVFFIQNLLYRGFYVDILNHPVKKIILMKIITSIFKLNEAKMYDFVITTLILGLLKLVKLRE